MSFIFHEGVMIYKSRTFLLMKTYYKLVLFVHK